MPLIDLKAELMRFPDPSEQPTLTVRETAEVLGVGHNLVYRQCQLYLSTDGAEGIPVITIGRKWLVPTAALARMLGFTAQPELIAS